jgi:hypothetical protein
MARVDSPNFPLPFGRPEPERFPPLGIEIF